MNHGRVASLPRRHPPLGQPVPDWPGRCKLWTARRGNTGDRVRCSGNRQHRTRTHHRPAFTASSVSNVSGKLSGGHFWLTAAGFVSDFRATYIVRTSPVRVALEYEICLDRRVTCQTVPPVTNIRFAAQARRNRVQADISCEIDVSSGSKTSARDSRQ